MTWVTLLIVQTGKESIVPTMFWWDSQGLDLATPEVLVTSTCLGDLFWLCNIIRKNHPGLRTL